MTFGESRRSWSDARLIFARFGIHPDLIAFVDERGDLNHEARLESGWLDLCTRGGSLDARHRFLDHEIDSLRELDPHGLDVVELDANDGVRNQVMDRLTEGLGGNVHLLVG